MEQEFIVDGGVNESLFEILENPPAVKVSVHP
jgi:hypothetical protein